MYCQNFETEQINEIGVPDRYDFIFVISSIFEMSKILDKVKKYIVTIDFNNDINNISQDLLTSRLDIMALVNSNFFRKLSSLSLFDVE